MPKRDSIEILLVEDNRADVELIREGMEEVSLPWRLSVVEDGQAAIDYLQQHPPYAEAPRPDLILLDLNLPKKSGSEVLDQLKADHRLRCIPVLVLTSSRSEADVLNAYEHGANSYLRKPNNLAELYDLLKAIEHYWGALSVLPQRFAPAV